MQETFLKLQKEFERIKAKGYIRGIYNSSSSIGRTFEQELGLLMNKESVPDYNGIEIKTRRGYTKNTITLFSAVPDGEKPLEMARIKDTYGYPYHRDRNYKCLYAEVYGNKLRYSGIYHKYKLDVDDEVQKIYLCIYNTSNKLIEREVFWSYDYLQNKLENKLSYLALVHAWPNKVDNWNYFKYYEMSFYKLKNFSTFLELIRIGLIKLVIKVDIYMDEANYGRMYDHGCSFCIAEEDLEKLFDKLTIDDNHSIPNK